MMCEAMPNMSTRIQCIKEKIEARKRELHAANVKQSTLFILFCVSEIRADGKNCGPPTLLKELAYRISFDYYTVCL